MKQLTTLISTLFFLVIGVSQVWALPNCVGSYSATTWDNCVGTVTSSDGIKYVGEWKGGKATGHGTLTLADGEQYIGEWENGKRNGQGPLVYGPDSEWAGDKYVGAYKDDKRHGQGTSMPVEINM